MSMITTGNTFSGANIGSPELKKIFNPVVVKNFVPNTVFYGLLPRTSVPYGATEWVETVNDFTLDSADFKITDQTTDPDFLAQTERQVRIQMQEFGRPVKVTRRATVESYFDQSLNAIAELSRVQATQVDKFIQKKIYDALPDASANRLRPANKASIDDIVQTDVLTAKLFSLANTKLSASNSPTLDDGFYKAVAHPNVLQDLVTESGDVTFTQVNKYMSNYDIKDLGENMFRGDAGKLFGIEIIKSAAITPYVNAGGVTVYPTYVFGRNAFVVAVGDELVVNVVPYWQTNIANAMGRFGSVSLYQKFGAEVVKTESIVIIETAASIDA